MRTGTAITRGTILCGLVGAALIGTAVLKEPATLATPGTPPPAELAAADRARIQDNFGKLPLSFIENRGQADERVAYYIQSPGHSLYFTQDGHALRLTQGQGENAKAHTIKVELVNAAAKRIESQERATGVVSYFKGSKEQWQTGIPTHARIGYVQPWPGIDLAYDGHGGKLESIYTVAPHANPAQIRLRYAGQDSLKLDDGGNLIYTTSVGEVKETAPVAYQEIDGSRVAVATRYALLDKNTVGFQVAAYNPEHALVIDPTLVYTGYIGGSGTDQGNGIAVDGDGNAYVTGHALSTEAMNFPVTVGPDLLHNGGSYDAFVAKVNAAGTALVYAGYIGGSGYDDGRGIAVDSAGNAYVIGDTSSTAASFPVTVGPDLTQNDGGGFTDAFVAKVSADGTALVYAGYIGGSEGEAGISIAVDSTGNAYVTGQTNSGQATFPETVGPDLTHNSLGQFGQSLASDAFVAKVNADGSALVYAGYIGGSAGDGASGIAVDSAGNAYVAGATSSTEATFPEAVGPDLIYNGGTDAFVAKVNAAGTALDYAGYIGGSGTDLAIAEGNVIAVDSAGNAYVSGYTNSTEATFPVLVGPDLTFNGADDAFVAKVNAAGSALDYAGYIGGSGTEQGHGIAVDSAGNAYVTGWTSSTAATFPETVGPDLIHNGGVDAFVAKVLADGSALDYAGYIGGDGDDRAFGIAVDSAGDAYVTGFTSSTEATFPETVGPDLSSNGGSDAFVAKIGPSAPPPDTTPDPFTFVDQTGVARSTLITSNDVTITGINAPAAVSVTGGEYSVGCTGSFTAAAGSIGNGQTVCVQHISSASFSTATDTALTVGGVSDTFTSTTVAPDTTPDAFMFRDPSGVPRSTLITSDTVTISGINSPAAVTVTGGEYSIGCGGTFTAGAGSISNGQTVCVRHTSAATFNTATDTVLTIGGVSDTFTSITQAQDLQPDAFSFTDVSNVPLNSLQTSNSVTVSGINDPAPISVSGGEYSIGCTPTFTSADGAITSGQTVCLRHTAAATHSTMTSTTLSIGGVMDTFTSTTEAAGPPPDTTPDAFSFTYQPDVPLSSVRTSNTVTIGGINSPAAVTVSGGQYSIGCDGTFTAGAGSISNGQTVCVRHTSSPSYDTTVGTALTIGGISSTFSSRTRVANSTPVFSFTDQSAVSLGTVITSNTVTISGLEVTNVPISVTGGQYSIGCNTNFTSADGTISNTQTVCVRHTSSLNYLTATNTALTVGGGSDTFTSTTAAAPPSGGGGDGGGSLPVLSLLMLSLMTGLGRWLRGFATPQRDDH